MIWTAAPATASPVSLLVTVPSNAPVTVSCAVVEAVSESDVNTKHAATIKAKAGDQREEFLSRVGMFIPPGRRSGSKKGRIQSR